VSPEIGPSITHPVRFWDTSDANDGQPIGGTIAFRRPLVEVCFAATQLFRSWSALALQAGKDIVPDATSHRQAQVGGKMPPANLRKSILWWDLT